MNLIIICITVFLFIFLIIKTHKLQVELIRATKQVDVFMTERIDIQQKILKYEAEIKEYNNAIESITTASNEFISEMKNEFNSTLKLIEQKHVSELKAKDLEYSKELKKTIEVTRKETLKKSRAVIRGQATEHLAPFILKDTNPKDYRFLGNPIDYIHFEGLSNIIDRTSDEITSVNFIDIKTTVSYFVDKLEKKTCPLCRKPFNEIYKLYPNTKHLSNRLKCKVIQGKYSSG